jgi:hypothetical protein
MELTFYDVAGRAIAYCEDDRHIYAFGGAALGYLDADSVYAFDGQHIGWWSRGWIRDHHGAAVFFTEAAAGGPPLPLKHGNTAKSAKGALPLAAFKRMKPVRPMESSTWSARSGPQFFPAQR